MYKMMREAINEVKLVGYPSSFGGVNHPVREREKERK